MSERPVKLTPQPVTQAVWHYYLDEQTGQMVPAIGTLGYYRFYQPVRLDALVINLIKVRFHGEDNRALPAEITIHAWDDEAGKWQHVLHRNLPVPPLGKSHRIKLGGIVTRLVKVECLRQHHVEPNPDDQWNNPYNVPYSTLSDVEWWGQPAGPRACDLPAESALYVVRHEPKAPRGMTLLDEPDQVTYTSPKFKVGFSLRRPLITHLGWDSASAGKSAANLLFHRIAQSNFGDLHLASGPLWNTLDWDCHARLWGGGVQVEGNRVTYHNLHAGAGLRVDAEFEVRLDGMNVCLTQHTSTNRETLECEAWRLIWDGRSAVVATLGIPRQDAGRTGAVDLPVVWTAPGYGNLSFAQTSGDLARLQVDSWRNYEIGWAGIVFGHPHSYPYSFPLGESQHSAKFQMRVCDLGPIGTPASSLHPDLRRNWGPGLTFRAELAGFSNNALSTNCHLSQTGVTDLAASTHLPKAGPAPIELARYTATLALKDGRGAYDEPLFYQDSDPSILNMTGRIHQAAPNPDWLADVWPWIHRACQRILDKIDARGLVMAARNTGNSSDPFVNSTNAWDTLKFGGYDAYSNAETYRALRNVAVLARDAGDRDFSRTITQAAQQLRKAYAPCFYNKHTGWLGSWRSADGELHDYGHPSINGAACLYGLVSRPQARRILEKMEARRVELGLTNFRYGLPMALLPVRRDDHMPGVWGQGFRDDGLDAFGIYCNGCLTLGLANYYIRAMKVFGFDATADQIAREVLEGHELGRLVGGIGTGLEFHTFEGAICGYEGMYVLQFPSLLAIAQNQGWVQLCDPEFWPA
jgi:hypothetical protein